MEPVAQNSNTIDLLIYIIYHDTQSYKQIAKYKKYPYVKLIHIETTKYFEAVIFKYLAANTNEWFSKKYIALLTYAFETKMHMTLDKLYKKLIASLNNDYDLVSLHHHSPKHYILNNTLHGNLRPIFNYVLPMFDFKSPINYDIPAFYCNYWVAKSIWMKKYIKFALAFMDKLNDTNDIQLQTLLNENSNYARAGGKLTAPQLMKLFGVPHYTYHPFVMERLPSLFFHKNNLIKLNNNSASFGIYKCSSI